MEKIFAGIAIAASLAVALWALVRERKQRARNPFTAQDPNSQYSPASQEILDRLRGKP